MTNLPTFYGSLPPGIPEVNDVAPRDIPFSDLTKLFNDQMNDQLQNKLTDMCQEMKGEVTKLRKEVGSLKENISILNSKVEGKSKCRTRKKLPKDLSVSLLQS